MLTLSGSSSVTVTPIAKAFSGKRNKRQWTQILPRIWENVRISTLQIEIDRQISSQKRHSLSDKLSEIKKIPAPNGGTQTFKNLNFDPLRLT